MGREIDKKVKQFKNETIEMLRGWAPERFAEELYGNPPLSNESRFIIQSYLSDKPRLNSKVESFREKYQKLKD